MIPITCAFGVVANHACVERTIFNLQEDMTKLWDEERSRVGKVQAIKEKLDALKVEIEHAERGYDLNKAAELKYAVMPKLQVRTARLHVIYRAQL